MAYKKHIRQKSHKQQTIHDGNSSLMALQSYEMITNVTTAIAVNLWLAG
jgi:hypothetical protein